MITFLTFILLFNQNENPPGTIKVKNYFVDKTEIQNIHWLEFLHYTGRILDADEVQKLLPDSTNVWYSIPGNRHKPVVLITYGQALVYCAWRSKVVSDRLGRKVTYRLPTPNEWVEIARELLQTDLQQIEIELDGARKLAKKQPDQYRLTEVRNPKARIYNMFDNVTEMTSEIGIAMGSNNYELTDLKANLTTVIKYNSPSAFLGFRCIAEIE